MVQLLVSVFKKKNFLGYVNIDRNVKK